MSKLIRFFDRLEDHSRAALSRRPILYAMIGSIAIVLFWRGIWMVADYFELSAFSSIFIGLILMLLTGVFVSFFIGDRVIISGLRKEKKLAEKTAAELRTDTEILLDVHERLKKLENDISLMAR